MRYCCSSCKKMNLKTKPHFCIEFCVQLEKMPKETIMLPKKAFGDECLSNLSIKKWHKELKDGQKSVHDAPRCGGPCTLATEINSNTVVSIIEDNRHLSTRTLASLLNMSKMSVNRIPTPELKWNMCFTFFFFGKLW